MRWCGAGFDRMAKASFPAKMSPMLTRRLPPRFAVPHRRRPSGEHPPESTKTSVRRRHQPPRRRRWASQSQISYPTVVRIRLSNRHKSPVISTFSPLLYSEPYQLRYGSTVVLGMGANREVLMSYRHDLWQIAADGHGIVTTAQAADWGVPAVEMRKLAARGALSRVGRGVYRHNGVPRDAWTQLAGTLASVGPDAFLEGATVLAMFDLALVNPANIHVGTPRRRRGATPPHTVVTARPNVDEADLTEYEGLRSATVRRALLDAVPIILGERMQDAVVDAQRRDLITELEATEIIGAVAGWDQRVIYAG